MIYNTLSYSQIDSFHQCPRKWAFRYVDDIRVDKKSIALEFGTAIHETLEELLKDESEGNHISESEALKRYETKTNELYNIFDRNEADEKVLAGKQAISDFANYQGFYHRLRGQEILGIEEGFNLALPITFQGQSTEINIRGFIDLVYRDKSGIVVVDHKSSKKVFDKRKRMDNLQLPIYFMAIKQKYGELPYAGIYNFTQLGKEQVSLCTKKKTAEMKQAMEKRGAKTIWAKTEKEATKDIVQTFKDMNNKSKRLETRPTPLCFWCDFRSICKDASSWRPKEEE